MESEYNKSINKDMPNINRFSKEKMDLSKDPISDFYYYANGQWLNKIEIPDDKSSWGSFVELSERNLYLLKDIIENCEKGVDVDKSENAKKILKFRFLVKIKELHIIPLWNVYP